MPSVSAQPILSVIIVSYNTRAMTLRCLHILTAELRGIKAEVFVVDNASTDGSASAVKAEFPPVHLLISGHNAGFGAANNVALKQARGRYLLLINTDAFPKPGAIRTLINFLEHHADTGVVGPRLLYEDGTLQQSCFRFTTPLYAWMENLGLTKLLRRHPGWEDYRAWDHASECEVDFVIGACLLLRREVYEEVGGFDERFFMYQEEADWQRRIRTAGWKVWFTPDAQVVHLAGASGKDQPLRISRHFFESLDKYMLKHHGMTGFLLVRLAMLVGCSGRAFGWAAVALAAPWRRAKAAARARQHLWLFGRQLCTAPPAGGRG